jgi:hypothetical protein
MADAEIKAEIVFADNKTLRVRGTIKELATEIPALRLAFSAPASRFGPPR